MTRKILRFRGLQKRRELSEDYCTHASCGIERLLYTKLVSLGYIVNDKASVSQEVVGGYYSIKREVEVRGILVRLRESGMVTCLPRIKEGDKNLEFIEWGGSEEELLVFKYSIKSVVRGMTCVPRILLVPLVCFDRNLNRLGYGQGFYDATLQALRARDSDLLAIGIAYSMQEVARIEERDGDEKLDLIVTEREILGAL